MIRKSRGKLDRSRILCRPDLRPVLVIRSNFLRRGFCLLGAMVLLAGTVANANPVRGARRVVRHYDEMRGLPISETSCLAQDSLGFLWVGTIGGVFRFDGREFRRWAPETVRRVTRFITAGLDGEVVIGCAGEPLYRVTPNGVDPVAGPNGEPFSSWTHATFSRDGTLWVIAGDSLLCRTLDGRWDLQPDQAWKGSRLTRVFPGGRSEVFLSSDRAFYRYAIARGVLEEDPFGFVSAHVERADGRSVLGTGTGAILEKNGDRFDTLHVSKPWISALALRGDVIWLTAGQSILALRPRGLVEEVAPQPGLPHGRALLVDRERSIWVAGLDGLYQLPEPETILWTFGPAGSIPSGRFIERTREGIWFTSWAGLTLLAADDPTRTLQLIDPDSRWRVAPDSAGRIWAGGIGGFHERSNRGDRLIPTDTDEAGFIRITGSSFRPDETLWLATSSGLFLVPKHADTPRLVPGPPPPEWGATWQKLWVTDAVEDESGELWVTDGEEICHANADSVALGRVRSWQCQSIPDVDGVADLAQLASGALWCGTMNSGVWRYRPDTSRWEPIPGSSTLSTPRQQFITPSPKGGVWIAGCEILTRVEERPDLPEGWRVIEQPSRWEGVPSPSTGEVLEEANGDLWIAGSSGLAYVPAEARFYDRSAPEVQLVGVLVDGREQMPSTRMRLPADRNRVELRFAATSYRDPSLVRYQVRVRPGSPWIETRDPNFRFVDLSRGTYRAEIRASLDGTRWSATPARMEFEVLPPWYLEWWSIALGLALLVAAAYAAHRVRVGFLLRLERQRAQIAMDLHDEMGSGLGSIGLLAGLAATDSVDHASRRQLAERIAAAAGELGGALSDIVWSLRDDSATLEALASRLAQRGSRLFPDDDTTVFVTRFPANGDWPEASLPLDVRRNLQLIAIEAMYNAARHAEARRVELGFEREGSLWRMWVHDDGCGLSDSADSSGGNGIPNLRLRAVAIGAKLSIDSAPEEGTRVDVNFEVRRVSRASTSR